MAIATLALAVLLTANNCDPNTQRLRQEIELQRQEQEKGNSAPAHDTTDPYWLDVDQAAIAAAALSAQPPQE